MYTNIAANGYKLIYLSSRPIGLSENTKKYIQRIKQGSQKMPDGALIISPDRSAKSFYRELIIKKPHLFNIACLKEINDLFSFHYQPFYAGFGNRDTDYISYKTLGVDVDKIYIINP